MAKLGVIAGTVAITVTSDEAEDQNKNNPYLMRLQYQEADLYHYWSTTILGKRNNKTYDPVTKKQVQTQLGIMFIALKTKDYEKQEGWDDYTLGKDEPALWRAIIRMSIFVQTHGPTEPGFQQFHQEYVNPLNTKSPRIDLENIRGANLQN